MAKVSRKRELTRAVDALGDGLQAEQMTLASVDELLNNVTPEVAQARRGRGRPKGARNRRTSQMLEYLEALGYEPPILKLARVAAADTKTMALALGCKRIEAFDRQLKALEALMPYWHQKLPQSLEVDARTVTALFLGAPPEGGDEPGEMLSGTHIARMIGLADPDDGGDPDPVRAAGPLAVRPVGPPAISKEKQGVSAGRPGGVERGASNADG